jgi:hypothetical protein
LSKIIIYPNNSVDIDGVSVNWTDDDFKNHNINKYRDGINHPLEDECAKFKKNGNEYVVFHTMHRNSQIKRMFTRRRIKNPFPSTVKRRSNETRISN